MRHLQIIMVKSVQINLNFMQIMYLNRLFILLKIYIIAK